MSFGILVVFFNSFNRNLLKQIVSNCVPVIPQLKATSMCACVTQKLHHRPLACHFHSNDPSTDMFTVHDEDILTCPLCLHLQIIQQHTLFF